MRLMLKLLEELRLGGNRIAGLEVAALDSVAKVLLDPVVVRNELVFHGHSCLQECGGIYMYRHLDVKEIFMGPDTKSVTTDEDREIILLRIVKTCRYTSSACVASSSFHGFSDAHERPFNGL